MKDDWVKIEYWVQDTMESGHWERTVPMLRGDAEVVLKAYEESHDRPQIVNIFPQEANHE